MVPVDWSQLGVKTIHLAQLVKEGDLEETAVLDHLVNEFSRVVFRLEDKRDLEVSSFVVLERIRFICIKESTVVSTAKVRSSSKTFVLAGPLTLTSNKMDSECSYCISE